ncbi:PACE efflux transporter [Pseudoroseomonas wenyumeiae]|uniref:PACE efflux transporter n=1 Tax=Teichococcus wenyumeiae TaxID=2478470 RepID=A0A3A9JIP2_9PROT|nr:PACE efflux transporter [Pseudoroseomonas wenyumeiae]RKK03586.1 PACE efflux transporter [Pseudoroseomonas wenyumeiae]RMI27115.1 PACE efflux transporter [Pseudoroseomonas wenyumeiae]
MRTTRDRIRHAILFEVIGLALIIPLGSHLFGLPAEKMGVIGFGSALAATAWNYVYNLGFDHAMQRLAGHTRKSLGLRVAHALLFEAGLLMVLLPPIAWYLGIGLYEAFVMDLAIAAFYVVYAFVFNLAYDRVFPIPTWQQQTPA